jgi:PKD repeat protein
VYANPTPAINPSGTVSFCQGDSATISTSINNQYLWSNGATTFSIVIHTANTYTITATDGHGCTGLASKIVTVNSLPTPVITGGNTICSGNVLTLSVGSYSAYHWSNNAFTQSTNVTTTGIYSITVLDNNGCRGTASDTISVGTSPVPVISGGSIFCNGGSLTLNTSNFTTYLWNTGETTQSININTPNGYSITVSNATGCTGTATDTVTMSANPVPNIIGGGLFCNGGSVLISVQFFTLYHWSTGSGNQSINVTNPGTYYVTVTNINGCTGIASKTVNSYPIPTPFITTSNPTIFCNGDSTILSVSPFSLYHWSTGSIIQSIDVHNSGTYVVTVTDTNGCTASASQIVTAIANPTPTISPSGNIKLCEGETVTLLSSNGVTYSWNTGATNQGITVDQSGNYSVTVYYGANCSATSNPISVHVYPLPVATISSNPNNPILCSGDSIILTTNGPQPLTYLWNSGATTQSILTSIGGTFIVTVTDTNTCHSTSSITVTAYANPLAAFTYSNFVNTTTFTNSSTNASEYFWYLGDGSVSNQSNPTHTYAHTGTYTVKLIVTNPCGTDSIIHTIILTGINEINPIAAGFNTYPNPANDHIIIDFNSTKEENYSIQLSDITGRMILENDAKSTIGENQYLMNLSKLSKGVYIISLRMGDAIQKARIMVQ